MDKVARMNEFNPTDLLSSIPVMKASSVMRDSDVVSKEIVKRPKSYVRMSAMVFSREDRSPIHLS